MAQAQQPAGASVRRRRIVAMALIAVLLAVPVWLLIRSDLDGDGSGGSASTNPAKKVVEQTLGKRYFDKANGISIRAPKTWRGKVDGGAVKLRSRDNTSTLVITAPADAKHYKPVLGDAVGAVEATLRKSKFENPKGVGAKLAGLPAKARVVSGKNEKGSKITVLVVTAEGKSLSYLVALRTLEPTPPDDVIEAQAALSTLKLRK